MSDTPVQDGFEKAKAWYASKTIIGLIVSTVSALVFALSKGSVDIQGAVGELQGTDAEAVVLAADQVWSGVTFLIGTLVTLWGRLTAKTGIK